MKILLIGPSNLGDTLLTYPAMGAFWQAYPDAEFHLLTGLRVLPLVQTDPRFHRIWVWNKRAGWLAKLAQIGRLFLERFDGVVDFRHSLIALFLLPRWRTPILLRPGVDAVHQVDRYMALALAKKIPPTSQPVRLFFRSEDSVWVDRWLEPGKRVVVIAPGARSHLKRWTIGGLAWVADRLIREQNAQVLLVGESAERSIASEVCRTMREHALDLTGHTTWPQLAALLARAELIITHDSACLHAAWLMGVPMVALFGPTDEKRYGPRHPRSVVVRRHLVCAPCGLAQCPYRHECMEWITPEEVYQAAVQMLQSGVPRDAWTVKPADTIAKSAG
jgi:heptosyltransferase-2